MSATKEKQPESDDYNPFEHRNVEKPNSDIRSLANLIKSSLGSGLLAMPLAFSNAGWGIGIVGTVIIAFICAHCVHIFVKTSHGCCKLERKPLLGYAETVELTFANGPKRVRPFAKSALIFAEFSLFFTYMGVCCIFTVLIADSIKQLFDTYYPVVIFPVEYYCLILLIPLCLIVQIKHLKWLAPFSLLANILLVTTFAICLYYIFGDKITITDKRIVGDASRFPAFLSGTEKDIMWYFYPKIPAESPKLTRVKPRETANSTVIFAMEGIGVVMPVENVMKKPEHFLGCPSILAIAMTLIMLLYTTLGLFGYLTYGDVLRGSITLNLPLNDWPAICAKCFIAVSIFFTYPLHFFVVIDIFTRYTKSHIKEKYECITQVSVRTLGVILCGAIGIALPMLEQIINIVGALFYSILGLIIPGIIETVFRWEDLGKYKWVLWKNILIVLFGFGCMISGCAVAIVDVVKKLNLKTE